MWLFKNRFDIGMAYNISFVINCVICGLVTWQRIWILMEEIGLTYSDFLHKSVYLPAPPTVSHRPTWCQWIERVQVSYKSAWNDQFQYNVTWPKWPPWCRWHFEMHVFVSVNIHLGVNKMVMMCQPVVISLHLCTNMSWYDTHLSFDTKYKLFRMHPTLLQDHKYLAMWYFQIHIFRVPSEKSCKSVVRPSMCTVNIFWENIQCSEKHRS